MNQNSHHVAPNNALLDEVALNIRGILFEILNYKWIIICIIGFFITFTSIYEALVPVKYSSDILLQVEDKSSKNFNNITESLTAGLISGNNDPAATQMALMTSRFILDPVIKYLGLNVQVYSSYFPVIDSLFPKNANHTIDIAQMSVPTQLYNNRLKLIVKNAQHYQLLDGDNHMILQGKVGTMASSANHDVTLQINHIDASPGSKFYVIKSSDAITLNTLLKNLHIETLKPSLENYGTQQTGVLQISLTDTDPERLINILNNIARVTKSKNTKRKSLEAAKTLDFLKRQLPLLKSSLQSAEESLNQYRAKSGKISIKLETQQLVLQEADINKQIEETRLSRTEMLQQYTPAHPFIIKITDVLKQLEHQKKLLATTLSRLPASDQIAVNLMREVKVKNTLYLIVLNKIQELEMVKAGIVSDIRVLAFAKMPEDPLPSHKNLFIVASALFGSILGSFLVILHSTFFTKVKDPRWVEHHFKLTNLAIIPFSKLQSAFFKNFKSKKHDHIDILAHTNPMDFSVEALRSLRTSLQFISNESSNNIMTIMGVGANVGKSFIATNFAYMMANVGKRVLLIDADMRKGYMNDYFQVPRSGGLSDIISGNIDQTSAIKKTPYHQLSFLSCGTYPPNPVELLMTTRFSQLMQDFSQQYDMVIIDTPPIVGMTDSTLIGNYAGMNLLVLGANAHHVEEISHSVNQLKNAGIKLTGTIFNNLKKDSVAYGYYSYNYNKYYAQTKPNFLKRIFQNLSGSKA